MASYHLLYQSKQLLATHLYAFIRQWLLELEEGETGIGNSFL